MRQNDDSKDYWDLIRASLANVWYLEPV